MIDQFEAFLGLGPSKTQLAPHARGSKRGETENHLRIVLASTQMARPASGEAHLRPRPRQNTRSIPLVPPSRTNPKVSRHLRGTQQTKTNTQTKTHNQNK